MQRAAQKRREIVRLTRRDVHKQHLVEVAERVFAERGYEGTRMTDVAQAADVAMATLYSLVESKEALYAEVHRSRGGAMLESAMAATARAGSAWQAILSGVRAYGEFLVAHPDYLKLHLQESQPWALNPRFTTTPQTRLWRDGLELTVQMFRAAIAEGAVVDESPSLLARLMIAAHQVYLGEWVASGMKQDPAELVARMQAWVERSMGQRPHRARR